MYKEINLYDTTLSEDDVINAVFLAIGMDISNIFIPAYYLSKIRSIVPSEIKLACPVDYPHGLGDTHIRQHGCISACNRGANFIDLVINPVYFLNCEKQKLTADVKSHIKICEDKNVELRAMLDYRIYGDSLIYSCVNTLADLGITTISPSTGEFAEDYTDNLIMCQTISNKNPKVHTIYNNYSCSKEQFANLKKAKIFGVRLKSYNMVYTN